MATGLNILVVEDNDSLRLVTVEILCQQGHQVQGLSCAEDIDDTAGGIAADIFILDLNLPGEDGISLASRLRKAHPDVGIIMVTARIQTKDKTTGYDCGADIYLCKPVAPEELLAAVNALARRVKLVIQTNHALELNTQKLILSGERGEVSVTAYEAAMIVAFLRAPGHRLENWQLIEMLARDELFGKASLEVQISRLRSKLKQVSGDDRPIKSIRKFGYQFCVAATFVS